MDELAHAADAPASLEVDARPAAGRVLLGLASWTFGVPGAALLAGLIVVAPALATAWAWIFGGFWLLVVAAGRAVELATSDVDRR